MGHVSIKMSPDGSEAVAWFGGDETDIVHIEGPAGTVDAVCRALRANETALEHEIAQRGASREPFASDLTTAEIAEIAEAAAQAKAAADAKVKIDEIADQVAKIDALQAALNDARAKLAPAVEKTLDDHT